MSPPAGVVSMKILLGWSRQNTVRAASVTMPKVIHEVTGALRTLVSSGSRVVISDAGSSADAASSNLPSTNQVFASTEQVVVVAHDRATPILVPKEPTDILQFEKVFFDSFVSVWSQPDVYTVTPVTVSLSGTDVQYYSVEWQVNRPPRDVRIDF